MKKNLFSLGLMTAAVIALASCAKEAAAPVAEEPVIKEGVPFVIEAGVETKTTATDVGVVSWAENDALAVFHAVAGSTEYGSNDEFTFTSNNSFSGTLTDGALTADSYDWYALYPYYSGIETPANTSKGYTTIKQNQTQAGNNSMAHLASLPLYGKKTGVAKTEKPSFTLKQALSIVKIHVTNSSSVGLLVSSVSFTAPEKIAGNFYINFAGDKAVFTEANDSGKDKVNLTVTDGTAVPADGADFYLAVKPFETSGTITVKVNDLSKDIDLSSAPAATTFGEGKIKTINFDYDKVITVADLPFSISGVDGAAAYSTTDGLSASGLGSDYAGSHSPYLTKFDSDGDYVQVHFNGVAGNVAFGVKKIGGAANSTFHLSGSADGLTFVEIETFVVTGSQNSTSEYISTEPIDESYRFLRLTFEKGANVGFGPLSISKPNTDPFITANDISDVPAVGASSAESTYSANNFDDDVEVKEYSGCVTDAVAENGVILYDVAPNYKGSAATGTIVLQSASDQTVTKTISVTQLKSNLTVSNTTITIPANATTATFTVTTPEFGYTAVASVEDGMNLSITSGASGNASSSAQTVTVSSTTEATSSEQTLGTITVSRTDSDPLKRTITIKKESNLPASTYTKVTSISAGTYLICNATDSKVISGAGDYLTTSEVTISSGSTITGNADLTACEFTITALTGDDAGKYSIAFAGNYLGWSSSTKVSKSSSVGDKYKWSIEIDSDGLAVIEVFEGTGSKYRYWGWYASNNQYRLYQQTDGNHPNTPLPTLFKKNE